jgi:hypothetical protein
MIFFLDFLMLVFVLESSLLFNGHGFATKSEIRSDQTCGQSPHRINNARLVLESFWNISPFFFGILINL